MVCLRGQQGGQTEGAFLSDTVIAAGRLRKEAVWIGLGWGVPQEVAFELGEEEVTFAPGQMEGAGSGRAFQARDPKSFPLWALNSS